MNSVLWIVISAIVGIIILLEMILRHAKIGKFVSSYAYGSILESLEIAFLILLVFAGALTYVMMTSNKTHPDYTCDWVLDEPANIRYHLLSNWLPLDPEANEQANGTLPAGTALKIIGCKSSLGVYVQTEDSSKGFVFSNELSLPQSKIEQLEKESPLEDEIGVLISEQSFNNLIHTAKTLQELDPDGSMTIERAKASDTTIYAVVAYKVFEEENGLFYRPVLRCAADGTIDHVQKTYPYDSHWNAWILKRIPYAWWVYDLPIVNKLGNTGLYRNYTYRASKPDGVLKFIGYILLIILVFAVYGAWIALVCCLPMMILGLSIRLRYLYYPLNNLTLGLLIFIVAFVGAHIISVVMLSEYCWLIYVPLSIVGFVLCTLLLIAHVGERCNHCKMMYTDKIIHTALDGEYDTDWYDKSEKGAKVSERTHRWTNRRTTVSYVPSVFGGYYRDESHHDTHHHKTITTFAYHDYKQKDHVKEYTDTHQCKHCGNITYTKRKASKVAEKKYVGTHTEEEVTSRS